MHRFLHRRFAALAVLNVVSLCVLTFYQTSTAAPPEPRQQPFANAVQQRFETIEQLKQMNSLLREQNQLLRSGQLRVRIQVDASQ